MELTKRTLNAGCYDDIVQQIFDQIKPEIKEPQLGIGKAAAAANANVDRTSHDPLLGPLSLYGLEEEKEQRENIIRSSIPKSRKKSATDLVLETYTRSLSGRMSKFGSLESFVFPPSTQTTTVTRTLDSSLSIDDDNSISAQSEASYQDSSEYWSNDSVGHLRERTKLFEENVDEMGILDRPTISQQVALRITYRVSEKKLEFGKKMPLFQSAAEFYGSSVHGLEVVQACECMERLNEYLREGKKDVREGVPGRFLHAVMGQELSDVGSIAATIMYAFYLHEIVGSGEQCILPVLNLRRSDLNMHAELRWLFDSCQIDTSLLVFIDEIDLSYYDLFGCLKLVLLNGHNLPTKQEVFKEALVEIFNCKQVNSLYPWVKTVTMGEDCSSCTLIAEKFVEAWPEMLAGPGFSRLLAMTWIVILPIAVKYKMFDISDLKVKEILRKDFKKWSRVAGKPDSELTISFVGMSSIGISVGQLLSHQASAAEQVIHFQSKLKAILVNITMSESEKLRLLMVVSGYYDNSKNFKREILVSTDTAEHMRHLLNFFDANSSQLPLKVLNQPGLREDLRAFEIDNKITSRKTIERLLEEFGGTAKRA
ncbi:hypothetical protein ACLOJK_021437 [Asimina triloba]